ncbi:GDSL esterase/lipase At4g10955 [Quercus suber]|uniref:GDSL esterase/lipase At4g10955 n=1 Tax=Quercus suber TaxID=58331 RepID=UPI000CE1EB32|nr:GDSL esterase/lipase At4g10955-like [Quercus suber]
MGYKYQWNNKCHVIFACLVDSVYILCDESEGSQDPALPCLDDFNFKLIDRLIDKNDKSIFGAIFEYKGESLPNIPQFVIAFRGTKLKSKTWVQDIKLDAKCRANTPHNSSRLQHATNYVREMVTSRARGASVWLAGHSLGAAIALLVGKQMFKEGHFLETYLFNPPFCSDFIASLIKNESVNFGIQLTKNLLKLAFDRFGKDHQHKEAQANDTLAFDALSNWVPHIFVHPDDPICSAYIHYFRNRQKMLEMGLEKS